MDTKLLFGFINFAALIVLLRHFLRQGVKDFLACRRDSIQQELTEVTRIRRQTEATFQEYRKRLSAIDKEITILKNEMTKEGNLEKEFLMKQFSQYAERIKQDTTRVAEQELRRAQHLLRQQTLKQALAIAKKVVTERVTLEDHERLTDDFITMIGSQI